MSWDRRNIIHHSAYIILAVRRAVINHSKFTEIRALSSVVVDNGNNRHVYTAAQHELCCVRPSVRLSISVYLSVCYTHHNNTLFVAYARPSDIDGVKTAVSSAQCTRVMWSIGLLTAIVTDVRAMWRRVYYRHCQCGRYRYVFCRTRTAGLYINRRYKEKSCKANEMMRSKIPSWKKHRVSFLDYSFYNVIFRLHVLH